MRSVFVALFVSLLGLAGSQYLVRTACAQFGTRSTCAAHDGSSMISALLDGRKGRLLSACMDSCFDYDNSGTLSYDALTDEGWVHPDGTGFKTEWCACSSPKPQSWQVAQGWIDAFNGYC